VKEFRTDQIRNVVFVGHGGTGKTSLIESMLFDAGEIGRIGSITDGTTVMDHSPDEVKRKISINLGLGHAEWRDTRLNLIDTPGYDDFHGDMLAGVRVADGAVLVISGTAGVEGGTERVWQALQEHRLPVLIAANMLDKEHADFHKVIDSARAVLSDKVIPLQVPLGKGASFQGFIDLFTMKAYSMGADGQPKEVDVPADARPEAEEAREKLIEAVATFDDALVEKYLDGQELTIEEELAALKKGVMQKGIYPVVMTSATHNTGIRRLLDTLVVCLPSPHEAPAGTAIDRATGEEVALVPDSNKPLCALVFKTLSEAHVGDLSLIRVYEGKLEHGVEVYNVTAGHSEKIGSLFLLQGKERKEVHSVGAGDIVAAVKLRGTHTGNTLTVKGHSLELGGIPYPEPILAEAIFPKVKGEEDKVAQALHKIHEEDPTVRTVVDGELHQQLLYGMGELQLAIVVDKLKRKYGVDVELRKPRIPFRETLRAKAEAQGRHKKQTGGRGQFGDTWIRLEPNTRGAGYEFVDAVVGGVVPGKFIPAVDKGIQEAAERGVLAGYRVVDFKATLYDGSHHSVDSSEAAFKMAGIIGFHAAAEKCKPVLLEPIMEIEVMVPDDHTGDVMGDLSSKRGKILGMTPVPGGQAVKALVPQAEMYRYSTHLRSLTQGRGRFTMKFSSYEEVPRDSAEKIIEEAKAAREKES
jgi:elongation factor G